MRKPESVIFFFFNVGCASLVFYFEQSIVAFAKAEHRNYFDASDSFTFIGDTCLIFMFCFLANAIWLFKASADIFKRRDFLASAWFAAAVAAWLVTFLAIRLGSSLA